MGIYVNPKDGTKEQWLQQNGKPVPRNLEYTEYAEGCLPVCLVDNGLFTAAGVCFSAGEFEAFRLPDDYRDKSWYSVPIDKLEQITGVKLRK